MRPRGPISLLALAIVATIVAYTSTSRPVAAAPPPRPERHVLDNGVRVIIQDHRVSDVVALHLYHISLTGRDVTHRHVRAVETVADIQRVLQAYPVGGTTVGLRAAG